MIPGKPAPRLITADMVKSMKPGSVIVDLAAERGGNCELTEPGEVVEKHGVKLIGYTDLPSRMAKVASDLYATNLFHLLSDLTPDKDGQPNVNMDDDVIRGLTVVHGDDVTWPPPQPEAPVNPQPAPGTEEPSAAQKEADHRDAKRRSLIGKGVLLAVTVGALYAVGAHAPESFLSHFTVFVLACFIGWQVIWNVTPSPAHTADERDQRHQWHHRHRCHAAPGPGREFPGWANGVRRGADCQHHVGGRLPGHPSHASNVPQIGGAQHE